MKRIIIATIMLVAFTSSSKASFKVGDLYYNILKDKPENSVEVTWVSTDASNYAGLTTVDIPSSVTYDGVTYKVLNIGGSAFEFCDDLQSITLPNTIDRIGGYAFRGCTGLKSIVIPNSVTYINVKAFLNCSGLESVTLSNSLTFLGDNAFHGCSSLKSVNIPSSLTEIESEMFCGCSNLTSITIPSSITIIGSQAFDGCSSLTSVTIPKSVTSIGGNAFDNCYQLTILCAASSKPDAWDSNWNPDGKPVVWNAQQVPEETSSKAYDFKIGDLCYSFLSSWSVKVSFEDSDSDFANNYSNLTSIEIPETVTYDGKTYSVTRIGGSAFHSCRKLTSITIPKSVTSIGSYSFYHCSSLNNVLIPGSVNIMEECVFKDCGSLTIYCEASSKPENWNNNWNPGGRPVVWNTSPMPAEKPVESFEKTGTCGDGMKWRYDTIARTMTISGDGYIDKYETIGDIWTGLETNTPWNEFSDKIKTVIVEEGVKGLGKYAFWDCDSLTTVILPSTCTDYGQSTFDYCPSLQAVVIAARNIWQANSYSFSNYDKCTLYVPKDLVDYYKEEIPFCDFSKIVGINYVSVDADVKNGTIESDKDYFLDGEQVKLTLTPAKGYEVESVSVNGQPLLAGTDGYVVSDINADLFISAIFEKTNYGQCGDNLTWTFNKTDKKLVISGKGAMNDYTANNIPWKYFEDEYGIDKVEISQGVTSIGSYAFNSCQNLTSVTMPNSVESIGSNAFNNCTKLTAIFSDATVPPTLGNNAFNGINKCTVTVPRNCFDVYSTSQWGTLSGFTIFEDETKAGIKITRNDNTAGVTEGESVAFKVGVNNADWGKVEVNTKPGTTAYFQVKAVASNGYAFVFWDRDQKNAEISVEASEDRTYTAYFAPASADIDFVTRTNCFWYYNAETKTLNVDGYGELTIYSDYKWGDLPTTEVEHVVIGGDIYSIDESTFQNFTALKDVKFPSSLKYIRSTAFNGCEKLESVVIPNGVKKIEYGAFYNCKSMAEVTLSSSLEEISSSAFGNCESLEKVVCKGQTPATVLSMAFSGSPTNKQAVVPCGTADAYSANEGWHICGFTFVEDFVYDFIAEPNNTQMGTVTIDQAPDCETKAKISATANKNYRFLHWSNGSTANPYELAVDSDTALIAIFEGLEWGVVTEINGEKSVNSSASFGDTLAIEVVPAKGYELKNIDAQTVNGETVAVSESKFVMPADSVIIKVAFEKIDYQIIAKAEGGMVTVDSAANYGDTVTFSVVPDKDYELKSINVTDTNNNNIDLLADKSSFVMPSGNVIITATFEKTTAITTDAATAVNIYAHHNVIVVENADADIYVYDATGRLVARRDVAPNASIAMPREGIYIVKCGNVAKRIYLGCRN